MVTLLVVPPATRSAIIDASSIDELAAIAQSIPATALTTGNRTPLDGPGVFECFAKALELMHSEAGSAPAKRVIARHLDALVSGSRAHGLVPGDNPRPRTWSEGHVWNPISVGSLGGVLSNIYDVQREYSRASEGLSETGRKSLKSLLYSIDAILKAVVYRRELVDVSEFDDLDGETF